jgi:hypothetical protein
VEQPRQARAIHKEATMPEPTSLENMSAEDRDNLASLAHKLANDPATRPMFLRMTKKVAPNTPIPELDLIDAANAAFRTRDEKIAGLEKTILEGEAKGNIEKRRADLKEQGFSITDIEGMEKWMVENQVPNYKTAAEFFKLQKQSVVPTPYNISMTNELPKDALEVMKKGGKAALVNHARREASKAIDDLRSGKVKFA